MNFTSNTCYNGQENLDDLELYVLIFLLFARTYTLDDRIYQFPLFTGRNIWNFSLILLKMKVDCLIAAISIQKSMRDQFMDEIDGGLNQFGVFGFYAQFIDSEIFIGIELFIIFDLI